MTNQASEGFHYQDEDYSIIAYTGDDLPTNETIGVTLPKTVTSTALYRGYRSTFMVKDEELVIKTMMILGKCTDVVNSVSPDYRHSGSFYEDINYPTTFTGYILFGNTTAFYVALTDDYPKLVTSFDEPIAYEVTVEAGHVTNIVDWSETLDERSKALSIPMDSASALKSTRARYKNLQEEWDQITQYFPRRYDVIYTGTSYNFGKYRQFGKRE